MDSNIENNHGFEAGARQYYEEVVTGFIDRFSSGRASQAELYYYLRAGNAKRIAGEQFHYSNEEAEVIIAEIIQSHCEAQFDGSEAEGVETEERWVTPGGLVFQRKARFSKIPRSISQIFSGERKDPLEVTWEITH